jgi:hypothetical protein
MTIQLHKVQVITQPNPRLCWRTSGEMMWNWRATEKKVPGSYQSKAAPWLNNTEGASEAEASAYFRALGLTQLGGSNSKVPSIRKATGANIRYALQWSPVVVAENPSSANADQNRGHIFVVIGIAGQSYVCANSAGRMAQDFVTNENTVSGDYTLSQIGVLDRIMGPVIYYW